MEINTAALVECVQEVDNAALTEAYWKLRDHAKAYRNTHGFRTTYEKWQANRDDKQAYQNHAIHEFFARGIEAAAQDIAEMLGVPEAELIADREEKNEENKSA